MEDDEEGEGAEAKQSPAAQALTTAKVQALAAAGRLVAFQVCRTAGLRVPKKVIWSAGSHAYIVSPGTCVTGQMGLFCIKAVSRPGKGKLQRSKLCWKTSCVAGG